MAADIGFAPLLALGPYGIAAYGGGQFAVGYSANIAAQKARGVKDISQAEAIAAGLIQIIPAGTTAKGTKGLVQAAKYGAGFSVGETFLRDLLGDDVSRNEYLLSLGLGPAFGVTFKGSLDGLNGIFNKIQGKTNVEADAILTKKDKKTIEKAIKNIDKVSKTQKQKLNKEGLNTDKLDAEINRQKTAEATVDKSVLTFIAPKNYARTKPRYGTGNLIFESDFDKLAWSLRLGKKIHHKKNKKCYKPLYHRALQKKK